MGGKVEFTQNGNLVLKEGLIVGNDNMRGSITLSSGDTSIYINRDWENIPSSVVVTPNYNTNVWITEKSERGFKINFATPAPESNASIDWMAIW